MDTACEHYVERDDENFLLDDETVARKCATCSRKNIWNGGGVAVSPMDDHVETLEDSPLLINSCYRESNEQFHCHNHLEHVEDVKAWKKLFLASILCFIFMVTELIGGFLAGSLAIMTDAAHLFSDFVGFLISLLSIWLARKTATKNMTFGYYRAEVLGAFLSVLTIWLLAAIFATLAINRLCKKEYEIEADTMILVASLGLVVNIAMGTILYGFCHSHNHNHNHVGGGHNEANINVRAAAAHVLGDLLQSFGVLVAAIIIKLFPSAKIADPVCTLIFSLVVICTTAHVGRDSIWLLLEGSPVNSCELANELNKISSVRHLHNLHIWTLSPGKDAVACHLCVDKYCDREVILKKATSIVHNRFNAISCTIQIETYNPEVVNSCQFCQSIEC